MIDELHNERIETKREELGKSAWQKLTNGPAMDDEAAPYCKGGRGREGGNDSVI